VNRIQSTIKRYTLALDQHAVTELAVSNSEGNLVGPSQDSNDDLLRNLDDAVDRVVHLLSNGKTGESEQLHAAEEAARNA